MRGSGPEGHQLRGRGAKSWGSSAVTGLERVRLKIISDFEANRWSVQPGISPMLEPVQDDDLPAEYFPERVYIRIFRWFPKESSTKSSSLLNLTIHRCTEMKLLVRYADAPSISIVTEVEPTY